MLARAFGARRVTTSQLHWGIKLDQERLGAVPLARAADGGLTKTGGNLDRRAEERRHLIREDLPPHLPPAASLTLAAASRLHHPNASTKTHGSTSRRSVPCPVGAEAAPARTSATTPARIAGGRSAHAATTAARSGSVGGEGARCAPAAPGVEASPDDPAPEPDPKSTSVLPLSSTADFGKWSFPLGKPREFKSSPVTLGPSARFELAMTGPRLIAPPESARSGASYLSTISRWWASAAPRLANNSGQARANQLVVADLGDDPGEILPRSELQ